MTEGNELAAIDTKPLTHKQAAKLLARLSRPDVEVLECEAIRADRIEDPPHGIKLLLDLNRFVPELVKP